MPQLIEVPDVGEFEFPDDFSDDQIRSVLKRHLPDFEKGVTRDLAARLGRETAVAGSATIRGAARGRQAISDRAVPAAIRQLGIQAAADSPLGEEKSIAARADALAKSVTQDQAKSSQQRLEESPTYQFGVESEEAAKEFFRPNPKYDDTLRAKVAQGIGSTIPVLAAGALGPIGPVAGMLSYGAQSGEHAAQEAIDAGRPEKADEAFLASAGLSAISEAALGVPMRILRYVKNARSQGMPAEEFGRLFRKELSEKAKVLGKEISKGGAREFVQEGSEQAGLNVIASDLVGYDPDRPLSRGVWEGAVVGGIVGSMFGGAFGGARMHDESPRQELGRAIRESDRQFDEQQWKRVSAIAADEAARRERDVRTRAPMEVPEPGPMTPEALAVARARAEAGRAMMPVNEPVSPIPFSLDYLPDRGFSLPPVPAPPPPPPAAPPEPPVQAEVSVERFDNGIRVSGITVPPQARGKGIGTAAILELINESNATGKPIYLTASAEPGRQEDLNRFYERLGFTQYRTDPLSGKPMYVYSPKPETNPLPPATTPVVPEPTATPPTESSQEWSAFPPETQTLWVPRDQMPQIKSENRGAMVQFLKGRAIDHSEEEVLPATLKPTQREYSQAKVDEAKEFKGGDRAILVSSDNHVLDGHHQWLAKYQTSPNETIRVIRLNAPIRELLGVVTEFPSATTADGTKPPKAGTPPQPPAPAPATLKAESMRPEKFTMQNGRVQVDVEAPYFVGGRPQQVFSLNGDRIVGFTEFAEKYPVAAEEIRRRNSSQTATDVPPAVPETPVETAPAVPAAPETIAPKPESIVPESETIVPESETTPTPKTSITSALSPEKQQRMEELKKKLRDKLKQVGAGVDPEIGLIGAEMTILYVEAGVKTFAQYARQIKADLPDTWEQLKKYLHGFWSTAAADYPELEEITRSQAQQAIAEIDATDRGSSEPDKKASEEQAEVESVKQAREIALNTANPVEAYRRIVELYNSQRRLGTRTSQSKTNQAYSTPPPLAYLAGVLADLRSGKRVIESTAGNGMLFIGAPTNAVLIANELDENRQNRLKAIFPLAVLSRLDASTAEFHDYATQMAPDRAVLNPPFGSVVEEGGTASKQFPIINAATKKDSTPSIDLAIALNTLDAMSADGKAVIIIGAKTGTMGPNFADPESRAKSYSRPELLEFFAKYNVVDWFTVDGSLYEKMGAGWPVDVIVIDGKGGTLPSKEGGFPRPWIVPPKVFASWEALEQKLYESQQRPTRKPGLAPGGSGSAPRPEPGKGRPGGSTSGTPVPGQPGGTIPPAPQARRPGQPATPSIPAGGSAVVPASGSQPGTGSNPVGQPSGQRSDEAVESGEPLGEGKATLNVPFVPTSKNQDPKLVVPRNIADDMRRAVQNLEKEVGQSVDDYLASKMGWTKEQLFKFLSAAQIEAVALFILNAETFNTGLINSDQTGVGKGRTVASVIEYALKNGKIPVFITASKQLYSDMAGRDLPSVGNKSFVPFITDSEYRYENGSGDEVVDRPGAGQQRDAMEEIAREKRLPKGMNGIFTTYYQLQADKPQGWSEEPRARARRKKNLQPRPDGPRLAMLRALAQNAIFILDEAHLAAGIDSDVGLSLQSILGSAGGVYYASATFAKRPDNLTLYALGTAMRLSGLDAKAMERIFTAGGIPMQQALTSMLAQEGEFVRREQNMDGVKIQFQSVTQDEEGESFAADTYTSFLRDLYRLSEQVNAAADHLADSENQVRPEEAQVNLTSTNFGSRLFQLSNQYLFSLRSAATAAKAIEVLGNGQKPFIAVYNTMSGPIADLQFLKLPLTFGGLLMREMQKMLHIKIKDPLAPADPARGLKKGERLVILKPEDLPDGGEFYRSVEAQIKATDLSSFPISPIDTIKQAITKAGYSIGELTAREGEVDDSGGEVVLTKRERLDRNKVLSDYNNGQLDALIVNGSGSTGLSAHTDPRFKDQRQRHMIVAQPAPDINVFMQMLGRIMRFGQTKLPEYTILTTGLAAERRFATMLRGKLSSLNANTSAETESGITQGGLADDIFNVIGDGVVAEVMLANLEAASLALIDLPDPRDPESTVDYARYATGRFVLLPNSEADRLWRDISETYLQRIKALDEAGENPLKANVEDLRAKTTGVAEVEKGTGQTKFDGPVIIERTEVKPAKEPFTYEEALGLHADNRNTTAARVNSWLDAYAQALNARLQTMRDRQMSDAQIDQARTSFERARAAVTTVSGLLGRLVAVDPNQVANPGAPLNPAFYGVPVALELRSKDITDFSSASKHQVVLATNTLRRRITVPLSQIAALVPVTDSDPKSVFDSGREASGIRYIVGGNLLKGFSTALSLSANVSRPRVTIYSTHRGTLKTGIVLSPAWSPSSRTSGTKRITSAAEFDQSVNAGRKLIGAGLTVHRRTLRVKASNSHKIIWGDRQFGNFFDSDPIQTGSEFVGDIRPSKTGDLFSFLQTKGVQLYEEDSGGGRAIEFKDTGDANFQLESPGRGGNVPFEYASPDPIRDAAAESLARIVHSQFEQGGLEPRLSRVVPGGLRDPSIATRVGLGEDTRRLVERTFGREIIFVDSPASFAGAILESHPQFIFLNIRAKNPWITVLGHELMEHLRLDMPEEYERLLGILLAEMKNFPVYKRAYEAIAGKPRPEEEALQEMVADFAAYEFQRPEFWKAMAEREPSLFVRLGQAVLRWLNGVIQKIRGFETSAFFRDVDRVRQALADAMATFAVKSGGNLPPTGESGEAHFMREPFENRQQLETFKNRPGLSPQQQSEIDTVAGAQSNLVPDALAQTIESLPSDAQTHPVEARIRSLLKFVIDLKQLADEQPLIGILQSNPDQHVKDAAVSAVLRQVEFIKGKQSEFQEELAQAIRRLKKAAQEAGKLTQLNAREQMAKAMSKNLLEGYRRYLTAFASQLPVGANVNAAAQEVVQRMASRLDLWDRTPDAIIRALEIIAENSGGLPVGAGTQAIVEHVRASGMLNGKVGQDVIDLLTLPKEGGLPSALEAYPDLVGDVTALWNLTQKKQDFAKQIAAFETLFTLATERQMSPVELKSFASAYRQWRNKQSETRKIINAIEKDVRQGDEDVQVYSRANEILDELQKDPQFREVYETALSAANVLLTDIQARDRSTGDTIYIGPISQKEFRISLQPDKAFDDQALEQMRLLLDEVDTFVNDPESDPLLVRTWRLRSDFIRQYLYFPQHGTLFQKRLNVAGLRISTNPWELPLQLFFNRNRSIRSELELIDSRGAANVMREVQLSDGVARQFATLRNDQAIGFAAITNKVLLAVKSHSLRTDQIKLWERYIAEPVIASHQALGSVQIKVGDLVNGYKVTAEDMAAIVLMKRFSDRSLQIVQKADKGQLFQRLKFFNPVQIQDQFDGKNITRNAFGTGHLTMARLPSDWGETFTKLWQRADGPAAKLNLIADGIDFRLAVMGYVRETNPEFKRKSPLERYYRRLADAARRDPNLNFTNLRGLVDWLADESVKDGVFATKVDAETEIPLLLVKEIDGFVKDYYQNVLNDVSIEKEDGIPDPVMRMATGRNSFTKPRVRLAAPSTFFSYSMAEDSRRTFHLAGAYTVFQLRQLVAMRDLLASLKTKRDEYENTIEKMEGITKAKAQKIVQAKTQREMEVTGQTRFDYYTINERIHVLEKIFNDMAELVSDKAEAFDSAVLYALSQGSGLLSSSLLSSPQAIANNTMSGILSVPFILSQNLGRASFLWLPSRVSSAVVSEIMSSVAVGFAKNAAVSRVLNSQLPVWRNIAQSIADYVRQEQLRYAMDREYGLVNPADVKGRLKAISDLKSTGGRIDYTTAPATVGILNWMQSIPGASFLLEHLKDKSPRLFDDFVNRVVARMQHGMLDDFKQDAIRAFSGRERLRKSNDFSNPANLLAAREIGIMLERDMEKLRQAFSSIGLLDSFLLDYYERYKAAAPSRKHEVPLFANPSDEATVLFEFAVKGNLTTPSNIPAAFQGVGYKGQVKRLIWMFWGFATRLAEQLGQLNVRSSKDPALPGATMSQLKLLSALVLMALTGAGAWEIGQLLKELFTGRKSAQLRIGNVANDLNSETASRYLGIALVNQLPYYGEVLSRFLGNPGYKSFLDLTEMIPAAGLVRDAANTAKRIWETDDMVYPVSDFVGRWAPPLQPLQRLVPDLAGDITARNAVRALTAAAPKDIELSSQRGGAANSRQTPMSPIMRELVAAAYRGDAAGVDSAYQKAIAEKRSQGAANPEQSVWASVQSQLPARKAFGRLVTDEEERRLMGRMTASQRADYTGSKSAFDLIGSVVGKEIRDVRRPAVLPQDREEPSVPRLVRGRSGLRRRRTGLRLPRRRQYSTSRARRRSPFSRRRRRPSLDRSNRFQAAV